MTKLFTIHADPFVGKVAIVERAVEATDLEITFAGTTFPEVIFNIKPLIGSEVLPKRYNNYDMLEEHQGRTHINFLRPVSNGPNLAKRAKAAAYGRIGISLDATFPFGDIEKRLSPDMLAAVMAAAQRKFDAVIKDYNERAIEAVERSAKRAAEFVSEYPQEAELQAAVKMAVDEYEVAKVRMNAAKDAMHKMALAALIEHLKTSPVSGVIDIEKLAQTQRERSIFG